MGGSIKQVPAKVKINPLIGKFIQLCCPDSYYRLVGIN